MVDWGADDLHRDIISFCCEQRSLPHCAHTCTFRVISWSWYNSSIVLGTSTTLPDGDHHKQDGNASDRHTRRVKVERGATFQPTYILPESSRIMGTIQGVSHGLMMQRVKPFVGRHDRAIVYGIGSHAHKLSNQKRMQGPVLSSHLGRYSRGLGQLHQWLTL